MRIREMMRTTLATVGRDATFAELVAAHRCHNSRLVYVVDAKQHLLGVVSCYDLLRSAMPFYVDANLAKALPEDDTVIRDSFNSCQDKTAADIMTREVTAVSPEGTFFAAEALFTKGRFNVLPVIEDDGRLVGELTRRRILDFLAGHCGL